MVNAFFVVWRESLEAFLIAGILYAWLEGHSNAQRGRTALTTGLVAGVVLAAFLGWALINVQSELSGDALDLFQTAALFVAVGLITQMVLWMRRHGRQMRASLHRELSDAADRSGHWGIAAVAALAVAREGAETVIFLYGLAQGGNLSALLLGSVSGFVAAGATAWIAAHFLSKLNLSVLLRLSSLLLLLLASAMLVSGCDRLIGSGWLPPLIDPVWDTAWLLDDAESIGKLFADFAGYRTRPALTTLAAWTAYWLFVGTAWRRRR